MKKWGLLVVAAIGVSMLGGCALIPGASGPKSYSKVAELKAAYLDAGGVCTDWEQDNVVKLAKQSGVCGDDVVLSVYANKEDRDGVVGAARSLSIGGKWLVGPNWIVNSPDAKKVQKDLGGKLVSLESD